MRPLLRSTMSGSNDEILELINNKFEEFKVEMKEEIQDMKSQVTELKEILECKVGVISKLEEEVCFLKAKCLKLENLVDEEDSHVRRESLIFSGSKVKPAEPNENCAYIARQLIRDVLKLPIDAPISTSHRVGKPLAPNSSAPDTRGIVVKFCRRDDKFLVYKAARELKDRGLFVNESLTTNRKKILYVLRQTRKMKDSPVTGTSTHNGRVFVYTKPAPNAPDGQPSIRTEINTWDRLSDFCTNFVKKPLESFLEKS